MSFCPREYKPNPWWKDLYFYLIYCLEWRIPVLSKIYRKYFCKSFSKIQLPRIKVPFEPLPWDTKDFVMTSSFDNNSNVPTFPMDFVYSEKRRWEFWKRDNVKKL